MDLNDYGCINSSKYAKELWLFLKKKIESNLSVAGFTPELTLEYWMKGSINIIVTIERASNEEWSKEEIIEIEEQMTKFAEHFEFTGYLSKCKMTFKSERPARKSTFGLDFQLNVFSEKMTTHFNHITREECLKLSCKMKCKMPKTK